MAITVIIPTSPIPSHPSTAIIEKVIASVRKHLPEAQIVIMMDGIRPSVEFRRAQYEDYKNRLKALNLPNVAWVEFHRPTQQAMMLRHVLPQASTESFMFIEHDAYLDERPIPFQDFEDALALVNLIRLYWHPVIHPEHEYLMHGNCGTEFMKTTQFSGWPFVSKTKWFAELIDKHFSLGQSAMIETVLYSPIVSAPWDEYKLVIWTASDRDFVSFHHLNGRVGDDGVKDPGEW